MPPEPLRVALFGFVGVGNVGNDASFGVGLDMVRRYLPDAEVVGIGSARGVSELFGLPGHELRWRRPDARWFKAVNRALPGVVGLSRDALHAWACLRRTAVLVVPGTGVLDDIGEGPLRMPFLLCAWSWAARVRRARVGFLSVGAGPVRNPMSLRFLRAAARAASYRSYRDRRSLEFMAGSGLDTRDDSVSPDLVFAVPEPAERPHEAWSTPIPLAVVAVMDYAGVDPAGPQKVIRERYLAATAGVVRGLHERGYRTRILSADLRDRDAAREVSRRVGGIVDSLAWVSSMIDLSAEVRRADVVVATRFHSVLAALKAGRPTVSVGYAAKNDDLMAEMGMGEYCSSADEADAETVLSHVDALRRNWSVICDHPIERRARYTDMLARQEADFARRVLLPARRSPGRRRCAGLGR